MPFIINEDKALRLHLKGMKVSDDKDNEREVGVWFGLPDLEIRTTQFPYLTIDLVDIVKDPARSMCNMVELDYVPEGVVNDADTVILTEFPLPIDLYYQITSYSRHPRHDREILSTMITSKVPWQYGGILVPEDGTVRPLMLEQIAKRDTVDKDNKRLFQNIFTVRVFSEMYPTALNTALEKVEQVQITITQTALNAPVTQP